MDAANFRGRDEVLPRAANVHDVNVVVANCVKRPVIAALSRMELHLTNFQFLAFVFRR
jgi:hypothetical protein